MDKFAAELIEEVEICACITDLCNTFNETAAFPRLSNAAATCSFFISFIMAVTASTLCHN